MRVWRDGLTHHWRYATAVRLLSEHSNVCSHRRTVGVEAAATGRATGGRPMGAPVQLVRRRRDVVVHVAKPDDNAHLIQKMEDEGKNIVRSLPDPCTASHHRPPESRAHPVFTRM